MLHTLLMAHVPQPVWPPSIWHSLDLLCEPEKQQATVADLFAIEFPHLNTLWSCSSVHASRSTDFTRLIWVPIPRWMPEHRMQTKTPMFQLAHLGSGKGQRPDMLLGQVWICSTLILLAVCADLVALKLKEVFDRGLVFCGTVWTGATRHSMGPMMANSYKMKGGSVRSLAVRLLDSLPPCT